MYYFAPPTLSPSPTNMFVLALTGIFFVACLHGAGAQSGVCYGTMGDNLGSPQQVVSLYQQNNIKRMRIYGPKADILGALSGSNIELMLDVSNGQLPNLASSQSNAATWVQSNVQSNPNVNIRYIIVGNEVRPDKAGGDDSAQYASFVLRAMQNVQSAINQAGLGGRIKVSTAFDMGVLGTSYPPSAGAFNSAIASSYLNPIVQFLAGNGAPLMMNVYPYFSYNNGNSGIDLTYALFTAPGTVVTDPGNGLGYQNLFDAMVDAVYSALERAGAGSVPIVVSESGWPSDGSGPATSIDNARTYNNNLLRHVRGGTPKRPGNELETYIFAMFDENNKTPDYEKHWGLFSPNMQTKYPFHF